MTSFSMQMVVVLTLLGLAEIERMQPYFTVSSSRLTCQARQLPISQSHRAADMHRPSFHVLTILFLIDLTGLHLSTE